jgi:hypothetical protein
MALRFIALLHVREYICTNSTIYIINNNKYAAHGALSSAEIQTTSFYAVNKCDEIQDHDHMIVLSGSLSDQPFVDDSVVAKNPIYIIQGGYRLSTKGTGKLGKR